MLGTMPACRSPAPPSPPSPPLSPPCICWCSGAGDQPHGGRQRRPAPREAPSHGRELAQPAARQVRGGGGVCATALMQGPLQRLLPMLACEPTGRATHPSTCLLACVLPRCRIQLALPPPGSAAAAGAEAGLRTATLRGSSLQPTGLLVACRVGEGGLTSASAAVRHPSPMQH